MTTTDTFDVTGLARAVETRDAAAQLAAYAPNATLVIVDRDNPPSRPLVVTGTTALREHIADFTAREMTHTVHTTVSTPDHVAFELACRYPDGTQVRCMCIAGITDGHIAWQHQVQAWDA